MAAVKRLTTNAKWKSIFYSLGNIFFFFLARFRNFFLISHQALSKLILRPWLKKKSPNWNRICEKISSRNYYTGVPIKRLGIYPLSLAMNPLFIYRSNLFPFIYPIRECIIAFIYSEKRRNFHDRTLYVSNLFYERRVSSRSFFAPSLPSDHCSSFVLLSSILIIVLDSISPYLSLDKTKKSNRVIWRRYTKPVYNLVFLGSALMVWTQPAIGFIMGTLWHSQNFPANGSACWQGSSVCLYGYKVRKHLYSLLEAPCAKIICERTNHTRLFKTPILAR